MCPRASQTKEGAAKIQNDVVASTSLCSTSVTSVYKSIASSSGLVNRLERRAVTQCPLSSDRMSMNKQGPPKQHTEHRHISTNNTSDKTRIMYVPCAKDTPTTTCSWTATSFHARARNVLSTEHSHHVRSDEIHLSRAASGHPCIVHHHWLQIKIPRYLNIYHPSVHCSSNEFQEEDRLARRTIES